MPRASARFMPPMRIIAAVLTSCSAFAGATSAQEPGQFYANRTISILMGTSPGGSYGIYGRVSANHLSRQIPGKPTIIIEHMPGAGGAAAGNYIYGPGPQDGAKILLAHALPLMEKLEDPKAIRYESKRLQWLGAYDEIAQVMAIWKDAGAGTLEDLKTRELVFGSMATSHLSDQWAMVAKQALGAKFKVISGYTTGGALNLAMERGEIAGWSVAWESIAVGKEDWIAAGKVAIPLVFTLERMKQLPNVPTLLELAQGPERDVVEFLANGTPIARAMALGPNVPADRVAAMRKAFAAMMTDPEFLDETAKRRLGIRFRTAEETLALVSKIVDASPSLVDRVKQAVSPTR